MENALWNGQELQAFEIAKAYETEKEIRKASGRRELRCPDPECRLPILRYCHGEIKDAYFAHLENEECDYARFDKTNNGIMRTLRQMLYEHFTSQGFSVRQEEKLLAHHYTHLVIRRPGEPPLAMELATRHLLANETDRLTAEYRNSKIPVVWLVADNTDVMVQEDKTYFFKRFLLNESMNRDLIVINWDGSELAQYKCDPVSYEYKGRPKKVEGYIKEYMERAPLERLILNENSLTIQGFTERYTVWLEDKKRAFEKQIAEQDRIQEELKKKQQENGYYLNDGVYQKVAVFHDIQERDAPVSKPGKGQPRAFEESRQEVLPRLEQQQVPVRDSLGRRWLRCECCNAVGLDSEFVSYGGKNHINLGICKNCR